MSRVLTVSLFILAGLLYIVGAFSFYIRNERDMKLCMRMHGRVVIEDGLTAGKIKIGCQL